MDLAQLEKLSPCDFYDVALQLQQHIYQRNERALARGHAERDALTSEAALAERQRRVREVFLRGLGELPARATPLNARTAGSVAGNGFRVEKIIYESQPNVPVTANVYIPEGRTAPGPTILLASGHEVDPKGCAMHQIVCQFLVHAGFVVLLYDPIGLGERHSYWDAGKAADTVGAGTVEHDHAGYQCLPLGGNIGAYFLHEALRAVDYLISRPDVDAARIGVTGSSGGGMHTLYLMMADPRIAAAAPAAWISDFHAVQDSGLPQDSEQLLHGMSASGFDHADILLTMTPRPLRVLAASWDFFPIEGARRSVERCLRVWKRLGRTVDLDLVEDASTHAYSPGMARAAVEFFSRHLGGNGARIDVDRVSLIASDHLRCTSSGQVIGEIAGVKTPHDAIRERVHAAAKRRAALPPAQRAADAVTWLRARVERERTPHPLNPRFYQPKRVMGDITAETCFWWSQEGIINHAICVRQTKLAGRTLPVTIAIWDGGSTRLQQHGDWIKRVSESGRAIVVLNVSGAGSLSPRTPNGADPDQFDGFVDKLASDLIILDDDLAALRTHDVCRALDMIAVWPELDAKDIGVYGHGRHGVYARLAAAIDQRIGAVEIVNGMTTYAQWAAAKHYDSHAVVTLTIRGCLNYFDLDDL
jgi:cephalosporin-C deacetylase-like acetyl esterase